MTFKAGDKVYSYRFGIVELKTADHPEFIFRVGFGYSSVMLTPDGKILPTDKHPSIITLEEAEKRGFVRKKVPTGGGLRVKFRQPCFIYEKYFLSDDYYISRAHFESSGHKSVEFVSFVDGKLNECPPPQETIEWEEIV
jgi:hypothetical protein